MTGTRMGRRVTKKDSEELVFLPLGGAGEIGMNLNLYGYAPPDKHRWLMVDRGVTFGDGFPPGADVIMPDPTFIEKRRDRLDGLILTHAHEDHLGAVPYLWERLQCPVYATPFTVSLLKRKLQEVGLLNKVPIHQVDLSSRFTVGAFDLELITLTHSIPEPNAIAIRSPLGTVMHTGDWKLDPGPVVGDTADEKRLKSVGDEGVLAIVCDSTNVFQPGTSGSEADLQESLNALIGKCKKRVLVTCFASNVARLETIAKAARANGRDVVLAGRSLRRIVEAARENGYLRDVPAFLDEDDAGYLPEDKCLIICTGSQGEPRAALWRIATGDHPRIHIEAGDTVIFSSKIIPGNEIPIGRVHNELAHRGIELITEQDAFVHVSGHPNRDELVRMYQHIRPRIAVPVHGEIRHLHEHAALARACQVAETHVTANGTMVRLAPGPSEIIEHVPAGRCLLEGNRVVPMDGNLMRSRQRSLYNGAVTVGIAVNANGKLVSEPQITTLGLLDDDEGDIEAQIKEISAAAVKRLPLKERRRDEAVTEAVRIAVRRAFREMLNKKPVTSVHVFRIDQA
ncbi:MAG: ribonuclease J [Rhodospirillales bacterium]